MHFLSIRSLKSENSSTFIYTMFGFEKSLKENVKKKITRKSKKRNLSAYMEGNKGCT